MIKDLFRFPHFKDILVNSGGSSIASFLGLLFFLLTSRSLGPSQFGVFSALIAFSLLLSDVFDLGVSVSTPKFISMYDNQQTKDKLGRFLGLIFLTKISFIVCTALIFLLLVSPISKYVFNGEVPSLTITFALGGAIVLTLFNLASATLQSRRRYLHLGIANVTGNISRIILLIVVFAFFRLSAQIGILVYFLGNLVAAVIGLLWLPVKLIKPPTWDDAKLFFNFNRWLALAVLLSAVFSRIDNILLIKFSSAFQAGLYGASSKITFIFPLIISSLSGVWSAQYSTKRTRQEADKLFFETLQIVLLISLGTSIIIPLSGVIINLVYGKAFAQSIFPMQLLFLGWIISLICVPAFQYVIYFLGNSRLYTMIIFIQFIAVVVLDLLLIPSIGALGAAGAFLIGNFVTLLVSYFIVSLSRAC